MSERWSCGWWGPSPGLACAMFLCFGVDMKFSFFFFCGEHGAMYSFYLLSDAYHLVELAPRFFLMRASAYSDTGLCFLANRWAALVCSPRYRDSL